MRKIYYVYRFLDKNQKIIYVGKTADIGERMYQHFGEYGHLPEECYKKVNKIEYIELRDSVDCAMVEKFIIIKFQPEFNSDYKNSDLTYSMDYKDFQWKIYNRKSCKSHKYNSYNSSNLVICKKRIQNGWTQQDVADKIGATKGCYSNIERGIRLPAYNYIVKLQRLFQMPIDELLQENIKKQK